MIKILVVSYQFSVPSIIRFPLKFKPFKFIDGLGFCNGAKPSKVFEEKDSDDLLVITEINVSLWKSTTGLT